MQPLQDEPKAEKEAAVPNCPKCGDNRQVWKNQISGKWTCHRAFCDTVIDRAAKSNNLPPLPNWLSQPPFRDAVIAYARAAIDAALAARGAVPAGWVMVPLEFVRKFGRLAHNYSLQAEPPFYYHGTEGDAFRNAYKRCGEDLAELRALLAAAPQQVAQPSEQAIAEQYIALCDAMGYSSRSDNLQSPEEFAEALRAQAKPEQAAQPTQAAIDVLVERQRQISAEGWTPEHDDKHADDELSLAAASYAICDKAHMSPPGFWPWDRSWWKPSDNPRRNLIKAGALILAEIERLDRAAAPQRPKD